MILPYVVRRSIIGSNKIFFSNHKNGIESSIINTAIQVLSNLKSVWCRHRFCNARSGSENGEFLNYASNAFHYRACMCVRVQYKCVTVCRMSVCDFMCMRNSDRVNFCVNENRDGKRVDDNTNAIIIMRQFCKRAQVCVWSVSFFLANRSMRTRDSVCVFVPFFDRIPFSSRLCSMALDFRYFTCSQTLTQSHARAQRTLTHFHANSIRLRLKYWPMFV